MELLLRSFFVFALISAVLSASLEKQDVEKNAFTAELDDGFHITVPKSVVSEERQDEDPDSSPLTKQQAVPEKVNDDKVVKQASSETSSPPTLIQQVQQTIQNVINPTSSPANGTAQQPGIIAQGIQTLQQLASNVIGNVTASLQGNDQSTSPGILQQTIDSVQQTVQQGFQNFNQTLQNISQNAPPFVQNIQQGIQNISQNAPPFVQNLQQGIQNLTNGAQAALSPNNDESSSAAQPPNFFQQISQNTANAVNSFLQSISSLASPSNTTTSQPAQPNIIQQGIQTGIQTLQNFLGLGQRPTTDQESVRQQIDTEITLLNATFQEGIKNITEIFDASEHKENN